MGKLVKLLRFFRSDDAAAVTVDWVALTSAMLLLGIMVVYSIFNGGVSSLVTDMNDTLTAVAPANDTGTTPSMEVSVADEDPEVSNRRCFRFFFWIICFG